MYAKIDRVGHVGRLVWGEIILRVMRASDLPALTAALADTDPRDQNYFVGLGDARISANNWLDWRVAEIGHGRCYSLASFDGDNNILGEVALSELNLKPGHANLSYWVRLSARRRGLGLAMATTLCNHGFTHLGLKRVEIAASTANHASQRLAHALGASRVSNVGAENERLVFQLYPNTLNICRTDPT